jgi:transcriptional regulator with XRE-family HTH domain
MSRPSASFGLALQAVRSALGLSQSEFGARIGVSRRTLTRWEIHDELPPMGQRKHIATSTLGAPAELRAALVRSLKLDEGFAASLAALQPAPSPAAAPAPTVTRPALDGAFLELCEHVEVAPGRMRAALVEFLRRAEGSGFSLSGARAHLEPKATKNKR